MFSYLLQREAESELLHAEARSGCSSTTISKALLGSPDCARVSLTGPTAVLSETEGLPRMGCVTLGKGLDLRGCFLICSVGLTIVTLLQGCSEA